VQSDAYLLCRRMQCRQSVAVGELSSGARLYYPSCCHGAGFRICLCVLVVRNLDLCKHNGKFKIKKNTQLFNFAIFIRNLPVQLQASVLLQLRFVFPAILHVFFALSDRTSVCLTSSYWYNFDVSLFVTCFGQATFSEIPSSTIPTLHKPCWNLKLCCFN